MKSKIQILILTILTTMLPKFAWAAESIPTDSGTTAWMLTSTALVFRAVDKKSEQNVALKFMKHQNEVGWVGLGWVGLGHIKAANLYQRNPKNIF